MDDVAAVAPGPEIMAVHIAVGIPQGLVMGVVPGLPLCVRHRVIARHRHAARPEHRIQDRLAQTVVAVLGEQLSVQLHP